MGGKIVVHLQLALTGPAQITGTILNQSNTESVTAGRDNFSKKGTAAPQAGSYTMALTGTASGLPQGIGYASVLVDTGGHARASGKLGDNTPFSASGVLSDAGSWPFYAPLYHSGGYVRGTLTFETSGQMALDGTMQWFRPASTDKSSYGAGFAGDVSVAGYHYMPPTKGSAAIPLNNAGQGVITFSGSVLSSGTLGGMVDLSADKALEAAGGGASFTLKLSPATGVFTGKLDAFNKKVPYAGVLLQPLDEGYGLFQSPTVTGEVQIAPAP